MSATPLTQDAIVRALRTLRRRGGLRPRVSHQVQRVAAAAEPRCSLRRVLRSMRLSVLGRSAQRAG